MKERSRVDVTIADGVGGEKWDGGTDFEPNRPGVRREDGQLDRPLVCDILPGPQKGLLSMQEYSSSSQMPNKQRRSPWARINIVILVD